MTLVVGCTFACFAYPGLFLLALRCRACFVFFAVLRALVLCTFVFFMHMCNFSLFNLGGGGHLFCFSRFYVHGCFVHLYLLCTWVIFHCLIWGDSFLLFAVLRAWVLCAFVFFMHMGHFSLFDLGVGILFAFRGSTCIGVLCICMFCAHG